MEIGAISTDAVLVLLNEGISKLIKSYEVIETIDDKSAAVGEDVRQRHQ